MSSEPVLLTAVRNLQNPIPQYVLGTLPAIAILGTTPHSGLINHYKIGHIYRYVRIRNGRVVDRVLRGHLHNPQDTGQIVPIPVTAFQPQDLHNKKAHVAITALASACDYENITGFLETIKFYLKINLQTNIT
ncbi:13817_t:CDS:2, partial [Racocetra fulgida]